MNVDRSSVLQEGTVIDKKYRGTVKQFYTMKGYGFIIEDSGELGVDLICRHRDIEMEGFRKLVKGQKITFEVLLDNEGRYCAVSVVPDVVYRPVSSR
ncbi:MAG: cold shock domain-containing protein [Algicola sp.]|nr:cold shock domain-containing protein [Algicola sp.]